MSSLVLELQRVVSHASMSEGNLQQVYILLNQPATVTTCDTTQLCMLPVATLTFIMKGQEEKTDVSDSHAEMFADIWDIWVFAVILNWFLRTVCICRLQH